MASKAILVKESLDLVIRKIDEGQKFSPEFLQGVLFGARKHLTLGEDENGK
jgi:hypothetical protein